MNKEMKVDLKALNQSETEAFVRGQGLEPYRAKQIRQWIFKGLVTGFHEMTNIAKKVRTQLEEQAYLTNLVILETEVSKDHTTKFLFRLGDGHTIESVLIPERDHLTLCISSQAGCAMGCRFCLTGKQGLKRNLTASEIADQVIQAKRFMDRPDRLTNIVLMGMGEPLANYDAVLTALTNIISAEGMNFSHHHLTLSTCGLVPEMERFGKDITVTLAVSLNAADDNSRTFLMPVNRKYPLKSLISACKEFPIPNRRMITFEYILIDRVNDQEEDAAKLVKLLKGIRAKINLIPLNPHPGLALNPSPADRILQFQEILVQNHFTAIIRKSKGRDISAACGQLSGKQESRQ